MTAILVVLTVVFFVALDLVRLWFQRRAGSVERNVLAVRPFAPASVPRGLFLDRSHTWVRLTESGELRIGVDELVSQALDGADRVELPESGAEVRRGQPVATITRRGRRLVIPSPVDGTVVASNRSLARVPGMLQADPYGSGWLTAVWPVDHREALKGFNVGEGARRWLEREVARFVDFLAMRSGLAAVPAALADGAHPAVGAALTLDERDWDQFQRDFVNVDNA